MAMMAMTTSNSIKVKADVSRRCFIRLFAIQSIINAMAEAGSLPAPAVFSY